MIISKLIGGFGNQMFQYAVGRRAAIANDTQLKLDITGYTHQVGITPRQYMLDVFMITSDIANTSEISQFTAQSNNIAIRFLKRIKRKMCKLHYCYENTLNFPHNYNSIPDNSYLDGYWIGEKYFIDIASTIRKDFSFKEIPDSVNSKLLTRIQKTSSVSIHVRRGDYVTDKNISYRHGICDLSYYKNAISYIQNFEKHPHFFIFSDDPVWCRKHIRIQSPTTFITENINQKDYEDMRLMSSCKHNIIANSTFSWWGAWLNAYPKKIVIAPKKWFQNSIIDTTDFIPNSWVQL